MRFLQALFDCFFLGIVYLLQGIVVGAAGCENYILLCLFASGLVLLLFLVGLGFLLTCMRVVSSTLVAGCTSMLGFIFVGGCGRVLCLWLLGCLRVCLFDCLLNFCEFRHYLPKVDVLLRWLLPLL